MNIALTNMADPSSVAEQRQANDTFRQTLTCGIVMLSAGILAFGGEAQVQVLEAIRILNAFDDDPWDDHALGDVEVAHSEPGTTPTLIFFRIDRPEPSGAPVLTIMLVSEW